MAVAVNCADKPLTEVSNIWGPAPVPSVQAPGEAMPLESVSTLKFAIDPPPALTANPTCRPGVTLPYWSYTWSAGGSGVAVPTTAMRLLPPTMTIDAGASALPIAVTSLNSRSSTEARTRLTPAWVPSRQLPTVATPLAFVTCEGEPRDPFPTFTWNVTSTPATALPCASVTFALS